MGWNGSGSITLLYDFTTDRDAGAPSYYISADKFDAIFADLATAMEATLNRNGENSIASNINWANYRITSLGAATTATDAVRARQVAENAIQYGGTTGGSANAYTVTNTFLTTPAAGTRLLCYASFTNTGASTINVNTGGATAIKQKDGTTALAGGEIVSGRFFEIMLDGSSVWRLMRPSIDVVTDTSLVPYTSDGAALGTTALMFSDLFLASGAVINFNNGNVKLTHSAGALLLEAFTLTQSFSGANPSFTIRRTDAHGSGASVGGLVGTGLDSASNTQQYGTVTFYCVTNTSGAEEGAIYFGTVSNNTVADRIVLTTTALTPVTDAAVTLGTSALKFGNVFLGSGTKIDFNSGDVTITHSANVLTFGGAASGYKFDALIAPTANDGAPLGSTALQWSDLFVASGAVLNFANGDVTITHATGQLALTAGTLVYSASNFQPATANVVGWGLSAAGHGQFSSTSQIAVYANRISTDGNVISINQDGTSEGVISVSGTTVSYGAFCGAHWSQLSDGSILDIPRGTVVESINEMCTWPGEDNDQLAKFKVSDQPASKRVYGVFLNWDADDMDSNDANIASLGAYVIRMAADQILLGGELLESDGRGCARVQADDVIRSSTIGKVTATNRIETYPDGSYLVPCVLYCG